jgi:sugar/nucleoside kinase (ribokinase family)
MVKKYDVITMGSGLVDAFVCDNAKESEGEICFPSGTKILVDKIDFSVGGGGTNTAACFSKLGMNVGFLGKTGCGYNGMIIMRELKKKGVSFLGVRGSGHTGYSIILGSKEKHRTILSFKGESDNLKYEEIKVDSLHTDWLYFTSTGKETFRSQKKIARWAKRNNVKLAYNPSSYHTSMGVGHLKPILSNTYFLSLNKEEAKMLVKRGDLFKGLRRLGPHIVCITDGSREGGVFDGEYLYRYWPPKTKIVERTGAGDTFGSSFVVGLHKLKHIDSALRIAIVNSASLIQKKGAQNGLMDWAQAKRAISNSRIKIKKEIY